MIIVDEEHDSSYKQEESVIYNARDMAIARASFENIPINLITAVPSVETYENIKKGKYGLSRLNQRYQNASLPNYEIINLNNSKLEKQSWLSNEIIKKVNSHLEKKDQVLFFLNRRGFSPHVLCNKCYTSFSCPNCSINLVYHKNKGNLLCHYCGYKSYLKRDCSKEGNCEFIFSGPGVERISDEVKRKFPDKKIEIFSSDTMNKKDSMDKLDKIIKNETNILVGTQLISKGFHFPSLNCIVVVDIDLSSQGHDLRGAEKNLQLYHQLSGRAGRTGKPATVYFQTYNHDTKVIDDITNKNPDIFLERELEIRKKNKLPPFQRFISLILTGENEHKLETEALGFKNFIETKIEGKVLGPVNAPIFRLKRKFRVRLLIRGIKSMKVSRQHVFEALWIIIFKLRLDDLFPSKGTRIFYNSIEKREEEIRLSSNDGIKDHFSNVEVNASKKGGIADIYFEDMINKEQNKITKKQEEGYACEQKCNINNNSSDKLAYFYSLTNLSIFE